VRSLLVILAGFVLVPLAQSAPPRSQASLSLTASSYRVLYGHGTTPAGRLSGTHIVVRVAMSVNQAGAGYLGPASHALVYRAV